MARLRSQKTILAECSLFVLLGSDHQERYIDRTRIRASHERRVFPLEIKRAKRSGGHPKFSAQEFVIGES
jgi:hypothetical protein